MDAWMDGCFGFAPVLLPCAGPGAGLGKEGSGITVPVAVKARPDKLGLGADGFKEAIHLAENKLVGGAV
jgi:hypothetical protein